MEKYQKNTYCFTKIMHSAKKTTRVFYMLVYIFTVLFNKIILSYC